MKTVADLISRTGDPVRTGFSFAGWYKESDYADYWDIDPDTDEEYSISSEWDFAKDRIKSFEEEKESLINGVSVNGWMSEGIARYSEGRPVRKGCSFVMRHGHGKCRIYGEIEKG